MVPSSEVADSLIPAFMLTPCASSDAAAKAVALLEKAGGEGVAGQALGLAWATAALRLLADAAALPEPDDRALAVLAALARHIRRPASLPVWAAVRVGASQIVFVWLNLT